MKIKKIIENWSLEKQMIFIGTPLALIGIGLFIAFAPEQANETISTCYGFVDGLTNQQYKQVC